MPEIPFTEKRPWGEFRQFTRASDGNGPSAGGSSQPVTVKTIFVRKGESLSLQKHALRSEFWRVISGTPDITKGRDGNGKLDVVSAKRGDEFMIGTGMEHRIAAPHDDVEILEIASGIFKEDDIVRIEDNYGRA